MTRILAYVVVMITALSAPLWAQDDESGGFLVDFLEDTLSGDNLYLKVTGLEGALSSRATIKEITVSDDDGVWLTVSDAVLDWNRLALVRGRFSVNALTAGEINVARKPTPVAKDVDIPSPETEPFSLPELPVSIEIGEISVAKLALGEPVLGLAADLGVTGNLTLADGALDSTISATRLDRPGDELALTAKFANETSLITLDLALTEDAGGLVSKVLNIPERPSLKLTAKGEGPVQDFTADITLASAGVDRLTGQVSLTESAQQGTDADAAAGIAFTADLDGDITPLLAPEYRTFFGTDTTLDLVGRSDPDGRLDISEFNLKSDALLLSGALRLASAGTLEKVLISGRIAPPAGTEVVLPMTGPRTSIRAALLSAQMDTTISDEWAVTMTLDGLTRPDLALQRAEIKADGKLDQSDGVQVDGKIFAALKGLAFEDDALNNAVGDTVTLDGGFGTDGKGILTLNDFVLSGEDYSAAIDGEIDGLDSGFQMQGTAQVKAADISRFADLAGQKISGEISAEVAGSGSPLGGAFDIEFDANGQDLASGIADVDPFISGATTIKMKAERGTEGLIIDTFRLTGNGITASANGGVRTQGTAVKFRAALDDLSRIPNGAPGPVTLNGNLAHTGTVWSGDLQVNGTPVRVTTSSVVPGIAVGNVALKASVDLDPGGPWNVDLAVDDISHPQLRVTRAKVIADGTLDRTQRLDVDGKVDADIKGLALGDAALGRAVGDWLRLNGGFKVKGENSLTLSEFKLSGDGYTASIDGQFDRQDTAILFDGTARAGMADLARLSGLAGREIKGAVTAQLKGNVSSLGDVFDIDLNARTQDLGSGIARLDLLIGGETTLEIKAKRNGKQIDIDTFQLNGIAVTANAKGGINSEGAKLTFDAMLDDLARVTTSTSGALKLAGNVTQKGDGWTGEMRLDGPESSYVDVTGKIDRNAAADIDYTAELNQLERFVPDFPGTVTSKGTATRDGTTWTIKSESTGPASFTADIAGTYEETAGTADVKAKGQAQLGAANRFIQPNSITGIVSYDLNLNGAPSVEAISGSITTSGTTVVIPAVAQTINDLRANIALANGSAQVTVNAGLRAGGGFKVSGPISLTAPFDTRLTTELQQIVLTDNISFDSSANGQLVFAGPLTGNGNLSGQIVFGETNINIAATSGSLGAAPIPEIEHVGETGAGRATRKAAGLIATEDSSAGPVIGLDISLIAENKVFARGRGLQAELGGNILVRGTTANVVPSGQVELIRGTFDILGSRLALTEGRVTLQGNLLPYIEFQATTSTSDGQATLEVSGPLDAPEIEVTSVPERPTEEALAMLIFGNRFSELSPLKIAQLALQIAQLNGSGDGATEKAREGAGLDALDIGTDSGGAGALGAGGYIADNVYTDVTVNTQGESELNLNLDVTDNLTLKGMVDNTGDTGIGIFFERDY